MPVTLPEVVTLPVPEYRDTYEDNETLYAVLYQGSRLVHEEEIKTRFGRITSKLDFNYDGPALNVYSVFSVTCDNVQGNVSAGSYVECDNVEQRMRRKQFYIKNGMTEMKMMVNLFGTNMEVLGHGCKLEFVPYRAVYEHTYGKHIAKNVKEVPYP